MTRSKLTWLAGLTAPTASVVAAAGAAVPTSVARVTVLAATAEPLSRTAIAPTHRGNDMAANRGLIRILNHPAFQQSLLSLRATYTGEGPKDEKHASTRREPPVGRPSAEDQAEASLERGAKHLAHGALLEALDERREEALDHEPLGLSLGDAVERR